MIDVIGMGCGGMDERYLVSRTLYVVSTMLFISKIRLKYLKLPRGPPVGYRFLNRLTCGVLGRCGCVMYGEGKVGYLADGGI